MEQSSSRERRSGPQVYVHLEFGLSWNAKPPKNHEVTYKSRGLRDRSPAFPRQVPAPNTNYLAAIHDFEQRHPHPASRTIPPVRHNPHLGSDHQLQEYYQAGYHLPVRQSTQPAVQEDRRASRAESSSSHERGHSAPPPVGQNPWDVSIDPLDTDHLPSRPPRIQTPPDQWKALPHPPSQYRLGEDGMPWSSWSWPLGYDLEGARLAEDVSGTSPSVHVTDHVSSYEASPLSVSVYSPGPSGVATGRERELGALSAAMMTVDNGFENQWWNQGPREPVPVTTQEEEQLTVPPASNMMSRNRWSTRSLGWAVAQTPALTSATIRSLNPSDIVSPVSESDLSPAPTYQSRYPQLSRTMSTRSEELWFTERGGSI